MEDDEVLGIFAAKKSGKDGLTPIYVSVMLDQKSCKMQLDTGDPVSILPKVWMTSSLTSGTYVVPRLSWRLTIASELMPMVKDYVMHACVWRSFDTLKRNPSL